MSIFRKSLSQKSEMMMSTSSDSLAAALTAKWWVSEKFAKSAALLMQEKQDEAMSVLNSSETPNADGWMKLAQEKAANDNDFPLSEAA